MRTWIAYCFLGILVAPAQPVSAESQYPQYIGHVVRVIDGDTLEIDVKIWPGITARYSVRENGIDSPELFRPGCPEEKLWAEQIKLRLERIIHPGDIVRLDDVTRDPFFGRVVADIRRYLPSDQWRTLEEYLLRNGFAEPWTPGQESIDWCKLLKEGHAE